MRFLERVYKVLVYILRGPTISPLPVSSRRRHFDIDKSLFGRQKVVTALKHRVLTGVGDINRTNLLAKSRLIPNLTRMNIIVTRVTIYETINLFIILSTKKQELY